VIFPEEKQIFGGWIGDFYQGAEAVYSKEDGL